MIKEIRILLALHFIAMVYDSLDLLDSMFIEGVIDHDELMSQRALAYEDIENTLQLNFD